MIRIFAALLLGLFLITAGCTRKANDPGPCSAGTVMDFTGLDGCGLVIALDLGQTLEPAILPPGSRLEKGKRVCVQYEILNDRASICMAGVIVKITSLKYLP